MITCLISTIVILSILLLASFYYNYKFANIILRVEDAVETSLDSLDERYAAISRILETPLFYDSPQIQQVIKDIEQSRHAVLYVANQLAGVDDEEKEN